MNNGLWTVLGIIAIIWIIGCFIWGDPGWLFTVIAKGLNEIGIGYGSSKGYPWQ